MFSFKEQSKRFIFEKNQQFRTQAKSINPPGRYASWQFVKTGKFLNSNFCISVSEWMCRLEGKWVSARVHVWVYLSCTITADTYCIADSLWGPRGSTGIQSLSLATLLPQTFPFFLISTLCVTLNGKKEPSIYIASLSYRHFETAVVVKHMGLLVAKSNRQKIL